MYEQNLGMEAGGGPGWVVDVVDGKVLLATLLMSWHVDYGVYVWRIPLLAIMDWLL